MRRPLCLVAMTALALTSAASANDIIWDNNIDNDGFNGRAVSPPVFPDIRVADDFTVGDTVIKDAHFGMIEDAGWVDGGVLEVNFYADTGGAGPGALVASRSGAYDRMATGRQVFDRDEYHYWIEFDGVALDAGTYWVGVRNPNGAGAGTNYWLTSDGGPDGMTSSTGFFSLDAGNTWQAEGDGWQHAFELTPAPGALALFGMAGLMAGRRRRR